MEGFDIKDHPKIEIVVGEQRIEVDCFISKEDIDFFYNNKNLESSEIIREIIGNHSDIQYKPYIGKISYNELVRFINTYIECNEKIKLYYLNSNSENQFDRFVEAFQQYINKFNEKMVKELKPNFESVSKLAFPKIEIPKIEAFSKINVLSEPILRLNRIFQDFYKSSVFETMRYMSETIIKSISDYSENFKRISNALAELVKSIKIPSISNEQKEALQESYKVWGQYGWTVPPYATLNVFNKKPQSIEEANEYMRQYINKSSMMKLFIELRKLNNIRKDDLEEAIENFENRKYKSCVMIIFALIDGKIIRYQNKEKNRKVGLRGAQKIYDEMELKLVNRNAFFSLLNLININSALTVTFANGDNFKKQPCVINRNFVSHGMLHCKVRRRDAAQLFLLLYNLIEFFD